MKRDDPRDQVDPTRAKHFAWSFVGPGDSEGVSKLLRAMEAHESGEAARERPLLPGPPSETQLERSRDKMRAACRALSLGIAEAWAMLEVEASIRATKRLLARADRLGVALGCMESHPAEAVRLLRLVVRHMAKM